MYKRLTVFEFQRVTSVQISYPENVKRMGMVDLSPLFYQMSLPLGTQENALRHTRSWKEKYITWLEVYYFSQPCEKMGKNLCLCFLNACIWADSSTA